VIAAGVGPVLEVPDGLQVVLRGDVLVVTNQREVEQKLALPCEAVALAGVAPEGATITLPGYSLSVVRLKGLAKEAGKRQA